MRSVLATLLSITLTASTSMAQAGPQPNSKSQKKSVVFTQVAAPTAAPVVPMALYECDNDQCEHGGGGALWIFSGNDGQAMWHYNAVAKLSVVSSNEGHIVIHREDPDHSYSSHFLEPNQRSNFYGDYEGNFVDGAVSGNVVFNDNKRAGGYWSARVVNESFCRDGHCPLSPDQLTVLGRRLSAAGLYERAYQVFAVAAMQENGDGMGYLGEMMANGWGGTHPPNQIIDLLHRSADKDSYVGMKVLAELYQQGKVVQKDSMLANQWNARAEEQRARVQARDQASVTAGKVVSTIVGFVILSAIICAIACDAGGEAAAASYGDAYNSNQGVISDRIDWYNRGGGAGGPQFGWHAGDPIN